MISNYNMEGAQVPTSLYIKSASVRCTMNQCARTFSPATLNLLVTPEFPLLRDVGGLNAGFLRKLVVI